MPPHHKLPNRAKPFANIPSPAQGHDVNSPNDMIMDTDDYVGVANEPDKSPVAIINPDNTEQAEADQLQDGPRADDCAYSSPTIIQYLALCLVYMVGPSATTLGCLPWPTIAHD